MTTNNERLSALDASNVEQYRFRNGGFNTFAKSVERFPRNARSVIIRSCFVCGGGPPQGVNGYHTVMSVQLVNRFAERYAAGQIMRYDILGTLGLVTP